MADPKCRLGCGGRVAITGSKCGRCIRENVAEHHGDVERERQDQLQRGLAQVRAALAEARGSR